FSFNEHNQLINLEEFNSLEYLTYKSKQHAFELLVWLNGLKPPQYLRRFSIIVNEKLPEDSMEKQILPIRKIFLEQKNNAIFSIKTENIYHPTKKLTRHQFDLTTSQLGLIYSIFGKGSSKCKLSHLKR